MLSTVLKYFTVYFLSGLKFIFGPTIGVANDLPIPVVILLTTFGMMTTVYLFTYFGDELKALMNKIRGKRRVFTKRNRQFVKIWRKFGLQGICLLTPLILTPPGGAILVNLVSSRKDQILKWMWISAFAWSAVLTLVVKYAYWLIKDFI